MITLFLWNLLKIFGRFLFAVLVVFMTLIFPEVYRDMKRDGFKRSITDLSEFILRGDK